MNCKTTVVVVVAVVFALVGTLVFASIAPYLSEADATARVVDPCGPNKDPPCGGGGARIIDPCGPNNDRISPPCGGDRVKPEK